MECNTRGKAIKVLQRLIYIIVNPRLELSTIRSLDHLCRYIDRISGPCFEVGVNKVFVCLDTESQCLPDKGPLVHCYGLPYVEIFIFF